MGDSSSEISNKLKAEKALDVLNNLRSAGKY